MSETEITCKEAEEKHGVTCKHGRMPNGELRFRLLKADGTAYIRTKAPPDGGWQNSHYHNKVKETYIVQSGWIGYAELVGNTPVFYTYGVDESFTTRPGIVHNVYMPANAVIHTVKHSESKTEQRLEDDRTKRLDQLTKDLSEDDLRKAARQGKTKQEVIFDSDYTEGYRHFDNLIWQVPAWSTAIFAVVLAGISPLKPGDVFVTFTGLDTETLFSIFFVLLGLFILVLEYALYRFRWHQVGTKSYTPKYHLSPQVGLQLVVLSQGLIFLLLSALLAGHKFAYAAGAIALMLITITFLQELVLFRKGRAANNPIETKS